MIFLNNNNKVIGYTKIGQGGIDAVTVDYMLIAKYAIDCLCKKVILVHNHPTGNLIASRKDKDITESIEDILRPFKIEVLDHIILSEDDFISNEKDFRNQKSKYHSYLL